MLKQREECCSSSTRTLTTHVYDIQGSNSPQHIVTACVSIISESLLEMNIQPWVFSGTVQVVNGDTNDEGDKGEAGR